VKFIVCKVARAEGVLDLQDGEGDLDEVGGKFTVHSLLRVKLTVCACRMRRVAWTRWVVSM
jgi:hypothetical protein